MDTNVSEKYAASIFRLESKSFFLLFKLIKRNWDFSEVITIQRIKKFLDFEKIECQVRCLQKSTIGSHSEGVEFGPRPETLTL